MAKGGNTWFKKLQTKGKQRALKAALGNEVGVMNHCAKAKPLTSRPQRRMTIEDKPLPKGPSYPKEGKLLLPREVTWKPEPYPVKAPARPLNTKYGTRGEGAWR
jgi:hypothetical protein